MNDKKNMTLKVYLDEKTEKAFKKIIEVKGITIQSAIENLIKNFIVENVEYIMKILNKIDVDAILDSGQVAQYFMENKSSL